MHSDAGCSKVGLPTGQAVPAEMVLIFHVSLESSSSEKVLRVCGRVKVTSNRSLLEEETYLSSPLVETLQRPDNKECPSPLGPP